MADESVTAVRRRELTEELRTSLAIHNYTMDCDTAWGLHKIAAIIGLIEEATFEIGVKDPMPDGINPALCVVRDILHSIMVRGGIAAPAEVES